MLNVAYKITLGSAGYQSGKSSRLVDLDSHAALGIPVNICRVTLDGQAQASLKPGDEIKIELGYDKTLVKVFSGRVDTFERGIQHLTVNGAGSFSALTAARFNRLYEKQNAGDIVGDLLGKLKVKKATVETGEKFATFTVSDHQSIWTVLERLAWRCGFDFYADTDDKAVFKKYAVQTTHTMEYGVHILAYSQESLAPALDGVEVYGESPVGQGQGDDASSWLRKKEVKGSAGKTSGNVLRLADASARTQDLARALAGNILKANQSPACGRVRVLGQAGVKLGDAVKIAKMPDSAQNGVYKVTGVRHRLNNRLGFVTEISWEKLPQ
jgi:phage protein D